MTSVTAAAWAKLLMVKTDIYQVTLLVKKCRKFSSGKISGKNKFEQAG